MSGLCDHCGMAPLHCDCDQRLGQSWTQPIGGVESTQNFCNGILVCVLIVFVGLIIIVSNI